jgi:hypothetical protein
VSAKSSKRIRHDSENSNQFSSDFQQIDVVHVVLFEKMFGATDPNVLAIEAACGADAPHLSHHRKISAPEAR